MAYCDNCKEERSDGQKFCDVCGAELTAAPAVAPPAEPPAQPPVETSARPEAESQQAPQGVPEQIPPAQPEQAPQQAQYPPQVQQAVGFFNKLGLGSQVAGLGALVSFIFTLIFAAKTLPSRRGVVAVLVLPRAPPVSIVDSSPSPWLSLSRLGSRPQTCLCMWDSPWRSGCSTCRLWDGAYWRRSCS